MTDINSRCVEFVRKVASEIKDSVVSPGFDNRLAETANEARAIVAELDGPKSDEQWAFAIEAEVTGEAVWADPIDMQREIAVRAIAKGRELAELERTERRTAFVRDANSVRNVR